MGAGRRGPRQAAPRWCRGGSAGAHSARSERRRPERAECRLADRLPSIFGEQSRARQYIAWGGVGVRVGGQGKQSGKAGLVSRGWVRLSLPQRGEARAGPRTRDLGWRRGLGLRSQFLGSCSACAVCADRACVRDHALTSCTSRSCVAAVSESDETDAARRRARPHRAMEPNVCVRVGRPCAPQRGALTDPFCFGGCFVDPPR